MISFMSLLFKIILNLFKSKKSLQVNNAVLTKENEILKRKRGKKKIAANKSDRIAIVLLHMASSAKNHITI